MCIRDRDTFDINKRWVAGMRRMLGMEFSSQIESADVELPITMVQVYCQPDRELDAQQLSQIRDFFELVRLNVLKSKRFQGSAVEATP